MKRFCLKRGMVKANVYDEPLWNLWHLWKRHEQCFQVFCVLMTCHQVNGLSPRGLFVDCLRHLASGVTRGVADKFALSGKKFLLLASLLLPDNISGKG